MNKIGLTLVKIGEAIEGKTEAPKEVDEDDSEEEEDEEGEKG